MKRGRAAWAFVEVMACPGGCLNGGGQVRSTGSALASNEQLRAVSESYSETDDDHVLEIAATDPSVRASIERLLARVTRSDSGALDRFLHTDYRSVPKDPLLASAPFAIKW